MKIRQYFRKNVTLANRLVGMARLRRPAPRSAAQRGARFGATGGIVPPAATRAGTAQARHPYPAHRSRLNVTVVLDFVWTLLICISCNCHSPSTLSKSFG